MVRARINNSRGGATANRFFPSPRTAVKISVRTFFDRQNVFSVRGVRVWSTLVSGDVYKKVIARTARWSWISFDQYAYSRVVFYKFVTSYGKPKYLQYFTKAKINGLNGLNCHILSNSINWRTSRHQHHPLENIS